MTLEEAMKEIERMKDKLRGIRCIAGNRVGESAAWDEVYATAGEALKPATRRARFANAKVLIPDGFIINQNLCLGDVSGNCLNRIPFVVHVTEEEIPL